MPPRRWVYHRETRNWQFEYLPSAPAIVIKFSEPAWLSLQRSTREYRYDGRGPGNVGVAAYLAALIHSNPTPDYWKDTRPQPIPTFDIPRMSAVPPLVPMWSPAFQLEPGYERTLNRMLNKARIEAITPALFALSQHFMIFPYRNVYNERTRANAVLEAIGLGWLTPVNPPAYNPLPVNQTRRKHYKKASNFELVF